MVFGSSVRLLFCIMCLWFDQFVFIALIMVQKVSICSVFLVLFCESRGCASIFLQHFSVITFGQVLFSGAYLHL